MIRCSNCNRSNRNHAQLCRSCGARLTAPRAGASSEQASRTTHARWEALITDAVAEADQARRDDDSRTETAISWDAAWTTYTAEAPADTAWTADTADAPADAAWTPAADAPAADEPAAEPEPEPAGAEAATAASVEEPALERDTHTTDEPAAELEATRTLAERLQDAAAAPDPWREHPHPPTTGDPVEHAKRTWDPRKVRRLRSQLGRRARS